MQEVGSNEQLFQLAINPTTNEPEFFSKRYKEFHVNLKENENGIWVPSDEPNFFSLTPDFVRWEGEITIEPLSILTTWKELAKKQTLELGETILQFLQLGPELAMRPMEQILTTWGVNPKKWLPEAWLNPKPSPLQLGAAEMFGAEKLPSNMKTNLPSNPIEAVQQASPATGGISI